MNLGARASVLCVPTGPDEYAVAVVRALAAVADVTFVLPEPMHARYGDDLPSTVHVHPVRWPRHRNPRGLILATAIARLARRIGPDVVHFLGDSVTWLLLALPLLPCPVVVTVHDVVYHPGDVQSRRVPMVAVRRLRRAAQALIVHGEGLKADLAATGVAPRGGIHVVDHPVLDRQVRVAKALGLARRSHDQASMVLFFGRMMAYKGLGLLIEASDIVARHIPQVRFVVAGQGPELERLRSELVRRSWFEIQDRYVPDAEATQLLLDADLLALPYVEASQSGVASLAIGLGLPVVATDVGALGSLVRKTGIGPVVNPDAVEIAGAIIDMLSCPAQLAAYRDNAHRAATEVLSPGHIARNTLDAYHAAGACPVDRRRAWVT